MEDGKTRLPAEKVPTLALNDPEPAARLERWAREYENGVLDPASRRDEDHNCRRTVLQEAPARSQ